MFLAIFYKTFKFKHIIEILYTHFQRLGILYQCTVLYHHEFIGKDYYEYVRVPTRKRIIHAVRLQGDGKPYGTCTLVQYVPITY